MKTTTQILLAILIIFSNSAQAENNYSQQEYIQGFNNTINVNSSSKAILEAIKKNALPNGKAYDPNPKGADLTRDFNLFKNSYGLENLKILETNIHLQNEFILEQIRISNIPKVEEIGEKITKKKLKQHINVLAADSLEGREVGEPGELKAAHYISSYFQEIGVSTYKDSTYYQEIPLQKKEIQEANITLKKTQYVFGKDFYTYPNFSDVEIKSEEVVFLGYGLDTKNYNDYIIDTKGKIIIILDGEPVDEQGKFIVSGSEKKCPESSWKFKLKKAKEKGVKAVLFVSENYEANYKKSEHKIEHPGVSLQQKEDPVPFFFINNSIADDIFGKNKLDNFRKKIKSQKLPKNKIVKKPIQLYVKNKEDQFSGKNILGFIEGSDPKLKKEIIVITAHYDHIGIIDGLIHNGADDNATGTAALMEIAAAFQFAKKSGAEFKRSILLFPNSAEEKGLLGSYYYVENPEFPLENTIACLNVDMIGRMDEFHPNDSNYVYLIGSDKLSTDLHNTSENANKKYINMDIDYTFNDPNDPNRFYYRSDHYNFAKKGIPSIFYFSGVHKDYHKHTDTVEKLVYEKVEKTAKLIFYTAWELSNSNRRPRIDKTNDFKLNRY